MPKLTPLIVAGLMLFGGLTVAQAPPSPAAAPATATSPFPLAPPAGPQIYPTPLADDDTGFVPIFNGTSLDGWDGDPRYWRVEDVYKRQNRFSTILFQARHQTAAQGTAAAPIPYPFLVRHD